jgi:hypothetical protein
LTTLERGRPSTALIRRICDRFLEEIPYPRAKVAKPQKSWAGLQPNMTLARTVEGASSATVTVVAVNSLGATLSDGTRLTDRNWKETYTKVRRRKSGANIQA